VAPERLIWGSSSDLVVRDVPCVGFNGDKYHRPARVQGDYIPYTGSVLAVDPSGRGSDETAIAVAKMCNGVVYIPEAGGIAGGYSDSALKAIAETAKRHKVNYVIVESNFGDGMFTQLLTPVLRAIYPVTVEEVRHSKQKEKRIIDTLEPVMNQHRLVVSPSVIRADWESTRDLPTEKALGYQLFYQMTRVTKDRGSLRHDDRLDALSMAVGYWTEAMAQDVEARMEGLKQERLLKEMDKFTDAYFKSRGEGRPSHELTWMER